MNCTIKNCPLIIQDGVGDGGCIQKSVSDKDFFCIYCNCPIKQLMKITGIKPKFYMYVDRGDLDCDIQEVSEKTLKKLWDKWNFEFWCMDYWIYEEDKEKLPETYEEFKKSNWWEKSYPSFNEKKQLELIKLIVNECQEFKIYKNRSINSSYLFQSVENWGEYEYKVHEGSFELCLAVLTIELLKNNKLDKLKVREILKDD